MNFTHILQAPLWYRSAWYRLAAFDPGPHVGCRRQLSQKEREFYSSSLGRAPLDHPPDQVFSSESEREKIAIRGDGKSPDQKVIDMQLQAANLVYIFDVIILSVTANKSGRLTVETSFLPLNSQASSYKVHSREITYKSSKGEQQFLNARHPLDLLYIYTIYYQNISKDIKVIERTSFPL